MLGDENLAALLEMHVARSREPLMFQRCEPAGRQAHHPGGRRAAGRGKPRAGEGRGAQQQVRGQAPALAAAYASAPVFESLATHRSKREQTRTQQSEAGWFRDQHAAGRDLDLREVAIGPAE